MTSPPMGVLSTKNWTPATPTLSLAVALTMTLPLTLLPLPGAVILMVGGVVSAGGSGGKKRSWFPPLPPRMLHLKSKLRGSMVSWHSTLRPAASRSASPAPMPPRNVAPNSSTIPSDTCSPSLLARLL